MVPAFTKPGDDQGVADLGPTIRGAAIVVDSTASTVPLRRTDRTKSRLWTVNDASRRPPSPDGCGSRAEKSGIATPATPTSTTVARTAGPHRRNALRSINFLFDTAGGHMPKPRISDGRHDCLVCPKRHIRQEFQQDTRRMNPSALSSRFGCKSTFERVRGPHARAPAGADRPLCDRAQARRRRHGRRLRRARRSPRAHDRLEDAARTCRTTRRRGSGCGAKPKRRPASTTRTSARSTKSARTPAGCSSPWSCSKASRSTTGCVMAR